MKQQGVGASKPTRLGRRASQPLLQTRGNRATEPPSPCSSPPSTGECTSCSEPPSGEGECTTPPDRQASHHPTQAPTPYFRQFFLLKKQTKKPILKAPGWPNTLADPGSRSLEGKWTSLFSHGDSGTKHDRVCLTPSSPTQCFSTRAPPQQCFYFPLFNVPSTSPTPTFKPTYFYFQIWILCQN